MLRGPKRRKRKADSTVSVETQWIRARSGGILRLHADLGQRVKRRDKVGTIADAFGENKVTVKAPSDGIVIGLTRNPLVHQGDAIIHIALVTDDISEPTAILDS